MKHNSLHAAYIQSKRAKTASPEARDYLKLFEQYLQNGNTFMFTNKQALTRLVGMTMSMKRHYLKKRSSFG